LQGGNATSKPNTAYTATEDFPYIALSLGPITVSATVCGPPPAAALCKTEPSARISDR
jgi:hypothetical protein